MNKIFDENEREEIKEIYDDIISTLKFELNTKYSNGCTMNQQLDTELNYILSKLAKIEYRLNKMEG
jgi:hypothetical protein